METKDRCPACGSEAVIYPDYNRNSVFYECPTCGRFQLTPRGKKLINNSKLAHYLFHNRFSCNNPSEYRYYTTLSKEQCDKYNEEFNNGDTTNGRPVHLDEEIIDNWYPKTLSERVDRILLRLDSFAKYIGQTVFLDDEELLSLLFIERKEQHPLYRDVVERDHSDLLDEEAFMVNCLKEQGLIDFRRPEGKEIPEGKLDYLAAGIIRITPAGYARLDVLQKNTAHGRNALVAMKFGDDTKPLREAIRQGITEAGYIAIFIDEVQYNDYITPELLKHIRDSKFVVVDLTHQNNGAYFEEGYAMGLGKPVIQLCKKDTKLHFDIAQKNTIMWGVEDDIPLMLKNRIKATIE